MTVKSFRTATVSAALLTALVAAPIVFSAGVAQAAGPVHRAAHHAKLRAKHTAHRVRRSLHNSHIRLRRAAHQL